MPLPTLIAYAAAVATALGLGLLVLVLIRPRGVTAADEPDTAEAGVGPVQRSGLSLSLISAAPRGYTGWLDKQVVFAGRPAGWSVAGILTWKLVLAGVAAALGALFIIPSPEPFRFLLVGAVVLLAFFLPDVMINSRAHDRQETIQRELPDVLDQMTVAVEAGLGFDAAMAKSARSGKGPLAEEMIRTLQDMSIGRTRRDAYLEMERRTNSESLRRFVRAVVQAEAYGISIADVLRVQASELRVKRRQRAEEQAMKVTVKIIFPLVFCLLPVLFIVVMTPAVLGIIEAFSRM